MANGNHRQNILESDEAFRVLKDIEQNPEVTQRHLSAKHSISLGKTNYILGALMEKGIIKAKNFKNAKNKAAYMYLLTPDGVKTRAQLTRDFIQRKTAEFKMLESEIAELNKEIAIMTDSVVMEREDNV